MRQRTLFAVFCAALAAAGLVTVCFAVPDAQPSALVSASVTDSKARITFHWDGQQKVPFAVDAQGKQVVLRFERPVVIAWDSAPAELQSYVSGVQAERNGTTVILTLNRPVKARSFEGYYQSGVDLADMSPHKPKETLYIPSTQPRPVQKVAHAKSRERRSFAARKPRNPTQTAEQLSALSPAAGGPQATPAPATITSNDSTAAAPVAPVSVLNTLNPSANSPQEATPAASEPLSFTLPLKADDPFAVFVYRKTLWIAADDATGLRADALSKQNPDFAGKFKAVTVPHAAVFTLPLAAGQVAAIGKPSAEGAVRVTLQEQTPPLLHPLAPTLNNGANGHLSITIDAGKADEVLNATDPASGNTLYIALLPTPGTGVANGRNFVEFSLLPSAQGIAVETYSSAVSVETHKGAVEITSAKGLVISSEAAQAIEEGGTQAAGGNTLFPYARWKPDDEKNFVSLEEKLTHEIAYGNRDAAEKARLRLLGLYLAEGLFAEAHGMSNDILRVSYTFWRDNKVAALRGAAEFFMYRFNEAERDFSAPELAGNAEAKMWLTLCKELLGESTETFNFPGNYERFIHDYPPPMIQKLAIIAADRSIMRKDYDTANAIFDILKRDNLDDPVKKYVDYMHAKVLSETHNEIEAAKIWEQQAGMIDDPLIRARAEFSLVNMLLREEKISPDDAARRLEKLRIVWRGDSLELNVLTLLGEIYIEQKQYSKALYTLRDIVLYYPEMPEAVTTARQMESIFVTLYNKGGADEMPPLEALSLFYEFRDLVPIGASGDEMIRHLAERLVKIDLLDRAALLLDHQVRHRLRGEERSRVGTELASIYLMNHQPKEALDTLETTGYGELPADIKLDRTRLTAQALAQEHKVDKAISVLSTDTSTQGALLRLSIYWDNRDWPNVVATAEEILGNRNDPSAPLSLPESEVLLKLATAYVYEHDTGQIQYLRDYFTPLLKGNPNRDSFLFITTESGAVDYDNLAALDQDISAVKTFLDTHTDQVKKDGFSKNLN